MATKLLVIVGPTAVGKSALGMELARAFDGEIISADSRQIYRAMDIGTAKPPPADLAAVRHHLLDIIDPHETYSLALFLRHAKDAILNIKNCRSRLPIVVGGTGQYIRALLEGWQVSTAKPNAKLRAELEYRAASEGRESLYAELQRRDPHAAQRIDPANPRRVIRALELLAAGCPPSTALRKISPGYDALTLGIAMDRPALYRRIDDRVDAQIKAGWLDEVRALSERGYPPQSPALSGLGYSELLAHLRGDIPIQDAIQRIKYRTHRYARQQHNWFRPTDPSIHWFAAPPPLDEIKRLVAAWLRGCSAAAK